MSDSPRVKKIKAQIGRLSLDEVNAVLSYARDRQKKLISAEIAAENAAHDERIKALPAGTRVLIRYGSRANHTGTITKQGRKYVYVALDNGEAWRFAFNYVDDRVDDEHVKNAAALNATVNAIFSGGD